MKPVSRQSLLIYGLYLALAGLITFPLVFNLSSEMIGHSTSDAYEMGHHIWWFKHALQTGQPIFYQPLSGYPDGFPAVSLWAGPLQFFPAWLFAFVMPVASAYNLTVLLTMALNGWVMYWVMGRWLQRDAVPVGWRFPAFVAGVIYMTFPTMQGHLFGGHAGLLVAWGAPLYADALFRFVEAPSRRRFVLALLFFMISTFGHTLQVFYVLLPITGIFIITRRDWASVGRAALVGLSGCVLLLIFLLPMLSEFFTGDTYVGDTGFVPFSIDLLGIVTPSFGHHLLGQLGYTRQVLGVNLIEGYSYFGVAAAILTLIAVIMRPAARWWLLLAIAAWVLALGPILKLFDAPLMLNIDGYPATLTPPWAFLYQLPGFSAARTPGRFTFTLALAVAALAGYGAMVIWNRLDGGLRARLILCVLTVFAVWEYQAFFPHYTVPASVPAEVAALADDESIRAVMDMPWENLLAAKQGLYLKTWHQKPAIAGQVSRRTPVSPAKLTTLEQSLDLALLDNAGVDVIILHKAYADAALRQRLEAEVAAPYYEDARFALIRVPKTEDGLTVQAVLPPDQTVNDRVQSYLFTPSPGWMDFSGTLKADGRRAELYLNGRRLHQWDVNSRTPFSVPLPVDYRGYHQVELRLSPPCPLFYDEITLRCEGLQVSQLALTPLSAGPLYEPVQFSQGVRLAGFYLPQDLVTTDTLPLRFWWIFDEARHENEIRFVKLLDVNGTQIAALDTPVGRFEAGDELAERLELDVRQLDGTYAIYMGWYTLPDVTRFEVLSDVSGARDGLVFLGTVTISNNG